jgi:hypothetical protein
MVWLMSRQDLQWTQTLLCRSQGYMHSAIVTDTMVDCTTATHVWRGFVFQRFARIFRVWSFGNVTRL